MSIESQSLERPQVKSSHYEFEDYMIMRRWISIWHQMKELSKLKPKRVLEIGPGKGYLKKIASVEGLRVETLDVDPALHPDYVGSIERLPFNDNDFDLTCAFQVLEHLPYEMFQPSIKELVRASSNHVLISLPNSEIMWRYRFYLPRMGEKTFMIPRPFSKSVEHKFDGEHYWEINKRGYCLRRVVSDLSLHAKVVRQWRPWENPYHNFFLLKKLD